MVETTEAITPQPPGQALAYHILRYVPNLVRDEWVNIGVLVFNPETGERRLRLIEEQDEYNRVRRLHPWADEALLRALRDNLENRLDSGGRANGGNGSQIPWQKVLSKWDETLSNALQIAPQKGVLADDLDAEAERLYARVAEFTFPGDPARLDYSYRRNGTRGFIHTLSVTRAPQDAKSLAYNAQHIAGKARYHTEFAAVTDVRLARENDRHRFVLDTLGEAGIEPVPSEGLAVWVAKLRPSLLQ